MSIVDVPGIAVGSVEDAVALTGCTVVVCDEPAVCGVDVRGGAPGTRETDLLAPTSLVERVDAIVLAGGSAFGLAAASGVVAFLEEHGRGYAVGPWRVPIVPAAILFDLGIGDGSVRPDHAMGYAAAAAASRAPVREGNYGAGCGATVGKLNGLEHAMKGGLGTASVTMPGGLVVGALVAVNAVGEIRDPHTGMTIAGPRDSRGLPSNRRLLENTTLAVVACNANLSKTEATIVARMAHDGFARAIYPAHTTRDGDICFALATEVSRPPPIWWVLSPQTPLPRPSCVQCARHVPPAVSPG